MTDSRTPDAWLLPEERRAALVAMLRGGTVRGRELADALGVSAMTIRRDADALVAEGLVERVRGGIRAARTPTSHEPSADAKATLHRDDKRRIAAATRALVHDGAAIGLGAGSTALAIAEALRGARGLTVATNGIAVAEALRGTGATVLLLGGERTPSDALVGPLATAAAATLSLDLVVLGAHALDPERGCTTPNLAEAETNRAMLASGRARIVAADASKWDELGLASFAALDDLDALVTTGVPREARAAIERAVGRLVLA